MDLVSRLVTGDHPSFKHMIEIFDKQMKSSRTRAFYTSIQHDDLMILYKYVLNHQNKCKYFDYYDYTSKKELIQDIRKFLDPNRPKGAFVEGISSCWGILSEIADLPEKQSYVIFNMTRSELEEIILPSNTCRKLNIDTSSWLFQIPELHARERGHLAYEALKKIPGYQQKIILTGIVPFIRDLELLKGSQDSDIESHFDIGSHDDDFTNIWDSLKSEELQPILYKEILINIRTHAKDKSGEGIQVQNLMNKLTKVNGVIITKEDFMKGLHDMIAYGVVETKGKKGSFLNNTVHIPVERKISTEPRFRIDTRGNNRQTGKSSRRGSMLDLEQTILTLGRLNISGQKKLDIR